MPYEQREYLDRTLDRVMNMACKYCEVEACEARSEKYCKDCDAWEAQKTLIAFAERYYEN